MGEISTSTQEKLQNGQMVLEQLWPHLQCFAHGKPVGLVGIVATFHGRQLTGGEVEVIRVGDGAPAL